MEYPAIKYHICGPFRSIRKSTQAEMSFIVILHLAANRDPWWLASIFTTTWEIVSQMTGEFSAVSKEGNAANVFPSLALFKKYLKEIAMAPQ